MPQLNTVDSAHVGPAANSGWQWLPLSSDDLHIVKHAVLLIEKRVKGNKPCNKAFKALPGGRTFADVWADPTIWISYDPGTTSQRYGATLGNEITISAYSLKIGYWTVAATLIHEMAHVDGADGTSHAAEGTLRKCLLKGLEDPHIIGTLFHPKGSEKLA